MLRIIYEIDYGIKTKDFSFSMNPNIYFLLFKDKVNIYKENELNKYTLKEMKYKKFDRNILIIVNIFLSSIIYIRMIWKAKIKEKKNLM